MNFVGNNILWNENRVHSSLSFVIAMSIKQSAIMDFFPQGIP